MATVETAVSPPDLPQVFGRYLLLKRLSRGGMGEIFLAKLGEIQGFEKLVIIKKILPNLAADEEFIKRFIDEAQVAIKLQHANIAPVFEVGRVDGEYFLAIEYVEGRDLRRLVSRQRELRSRLPPDLAVYIVRELAAGLAYAHRRTDEAGRPLAVVHCDISPPNVMLSFEGEVKVIDFGIAKSSIRIAGSNPNMGFGKAGYMAPEQLLRGGVVDRRTDVYAAGVVLYELLTGERLFSFPEGSDYRQIARLVTSGKFTSPREKNPAIDPALEKIVLRSLATKQSDRYQAAEELRDALSARLSQMNPTMSADGLAQTMRGLFGHEIGDERELVASMKAIDVEPFRDELTQSTIEHTITFAKSGVLGRRHSRPEIPAVRLPSGAYAQPRRRRTPMMWWAGGAMIVGGLFALWAAQPPPPVPRPTPTPTIVPTPVATPSPLVTPVPTTEPTPSPSSDGRKHHHAVRVDPSNAPSSTASTAPTAAPPSPRPAHTPEAVQRKFAEVKREYAAFKSQYGSRLEEQWNQIGFESTFGKADKYDKLDAMLDALRRDMAKVRQGG